MKNTYLVFLIPLLFSGTLTAQTLITINNNSSHHLCHSSGGIGFAIHGPIAPGDSTQVQGNDSPLYLGFAIFGKCGPNPETSEWSYSGCTTMTATVTGEHSWLDPYPDGSYTCTSSNSAGTILMKPKPSPHNQMNLQEKKPPHSPR